MIAADTSAWIDFSKAVKSTASLQLEAALADGALMMPMPVLFEVLSGPGLTSEAKGLISELPKLALLPGFWERAGDLRRRILKKGLKARGRDCLIAQNCIDHKVGLIAADDDFRPFAKEGLKLVG